MNDIFTAQAHPRIVARHSPDRMAVAHWESGESLSYRALVERTDRAAALMAGLGVRAGDTIAILLENHIRYAELCWAGKNSGVYYACISTHLNTADLAYILEDCGARLLFTSVAMAGAAEAALATLARKPQVVCLGGPHPSFLPYEALLDQQVAAPREALVRGASMLYSSGTTGRPKAVRPRLEEVAPAVPPRRQRMLETEFGFGPDMVFVNPGPLYHAAPLRKMMATHREGGSVICFEKFDPSAVLAAIGRHGATHAFLVPTMFTRLLRLPEAERAGARTASLRYAIHGAAPCPPSVKQAMMDWWGPVIHEVYGGTEGMGHTTIRPEEWLRHPGSVGRPPKGCEIKIVGDDGQVLPQGETGRIFFRNGNRFEYHNEPEKTAETYDADGFATFGDVGHVDAEGYLYLTDRQSHMIISGGVNIYPQEAENILIAHPEIADVAVIGVPDDEFGEEVKAIVEPLRPVTDAAALEADILSWCRARLSSIKCPRSVDFIDRLPRSELGKISKRQLKAPYWAGRDSVII